MQEFVGRRRNPAGVRYLVHFLGDGRARLRGHSDDARIGRIVEDCRGIDVRNAGERIMLGQLLEMF